MQTTLNQEASEVYHTSLSSMPSLLTVLATSDKSKPMAATESTYLWASCDSELYSLHRDTDLSAVTGGVLVVERTAEAPRQNHEHFSLNTVYKPPV